MRNGFRFFLWTGLTALLILLVAVNAASAEFRLIDFKEATIHYKKFSFSRHPLVELPQNELNLLLNTDFLKYCYWNNRIHSITDTANFRLIGWNFLLGVRVAPFLDIQYEHFSQHLLDRVYQDGWFPLEDSIGFKLYLYRDKAIGPSVLESFN